MSNAPRRPVRTLLLTALTLFMALPLGTVEAAFTFKRVQDPINDADRSYFYAGPLDSGDDVALIFDCESDGLNVYYASDTVLSSTALSSTAASSDDDGVRGVYRFDKLPASETFDWDAATDGRAAYLPTERLADFVKQARASRILAVRVFDDRGGSHTHVFPLDGLSSSLGRLSCAGKY